MAPGPMIWRPRQLSPWRRHNSGSRLVHSRDGHKPNTSFVPKELLTTDGRVETNSSTLRVDKAGPRIYAIGDVASYARPAIHIMTEAIPILGANIKRDLLLASGKEESSIGEDRVFKEDTRETQLVVIGKSKAVGARLWVGNCLVSWCG
jgi:hypothetical protein